MTDRAWRGANSRNGEVWRERNFAVPGVHRNMSTLPRTAAEDASGRKYLHHMRGGVAKMIANLAVSVPEDLRLIMT